MNTGLRIGEGEQISQSSSSACGSTEEGDMKLARLLQEEENGLSMKPKRNQQQVAGSNKFYVKINEDEFANDYPLPSYYKPTAGETDEFEMICDSVLVGTADSDQLPPIYHIEYMFEKSDAIKMVHGRLMQRGSQTVLANTADEREVFLTNICLEFELEDIKEIVVVEIRSIPWGHQHWKANAYKDKADRERARDRKVEGLSIEYYCKSLYWPERGAFFRLPTETMGLGSGVCHSCQIKETEREKEALKLDLCGKGFTFKGIEYRLHDFVYLSPDQFAAEDKEQETFNSGRNVGLKAYAICQLLEIEVTK
ncbi:hypothetical protein LWI28_004299 [Acer negundo]|uniref:BAH domain-containing protein n=1 Tax=Acer negundo TaxID=4023 RepID=A0AAD5NGR7_ACENE|nr:hypothetical protein LWI28_004299 [Acer negundo]